MQDMYGDFVMLFGYQSAAENSPQGNAFLHV